MEMFSFSFTFMESSSSLRSSTASTPLAATRSASSVTKATNSSDLATKSVSDRSWTMATTLSAVPTATAPSEASRSARLAWLARPFSRSQVTALSMSPSFSSRPRLASSMPTPVS